MSDRYETSSDDTVVVCPDCDTSTLTSCGRRYWCTNCDTPVERDVVEERPPREWRDRSPAHGLAAKLDDTDPGEVSR